MTVRATAGRDQSREDSALRTAAVMALTGAGTPVQWVNAIAAWWTNIDTPFALRAPAARAANMSAVSAGW